MAAITLGLTYCPPQILCPGRSSLHPPWKIRTSSTADPNTMGHKAKFPKWTPGSDSIRSRSLLPLLGSQPHEVFLLRAMYLQRQSITLCTKTLQVLSTPLKSHSDFYQTGYNGIRCYVIGPQHCAKCHTSFPGK